MDGQYLQLSNLPGQERGMNKKDVVRTNEMNERTTCCGLVPIPLMSHMCAFVVPCVWV